MQYLFNLFYLKYKKIEIKNTNIKFTHIYYTKVNNIKFLHFKGINANSIGKSHLKTKNNDLRKLISEFEIIKLVFFKYFSI